MSPWSARITTNRHIWQFVGHVLRMRSTFKSDGQKWQTSRQADKLTKACLGIGQIQIGLGRRDRGRALDLNSAWWSVDNLTDLFIYESQMHLSPSLPGPLLQPHNGLCGRHEIEIAKKSQFYRHARVTWPFEWMWTLTDTRTQVDGVEIPDKHFAVYLPSKHMSYSMLVLIANPLSPSTP